MSCLHKPTLAFPCQINAPDLMNRGPGSHPEGALGGYRSRGIQKALELTSRGDTLGPKPRGYNNDRVEMCRFTWKRSFGSATKGVQWLQERTRGKSLILAWTLSAVPARVWQMQQINPYLLPIGIKQNNASKCWPRKLAAIVTFVEEHSWETVCVCVRIVSRSAAQNHFCSLQHCRKSAYDCSQLHYINNKVCDLHYNDLFSYAACCVNGTMPKLLWICILAFSHLINPVMSTVKLSNSFYRLKTIIHLPTNIQEECTLVSIITTIHSGLLYTLAHMVSVQVQSPHYFLMGVLHILSRMSTAAMDISMLFV